MTWANGPMTGIALATTSADPRKARIVAIATHAVGGQAPGKPEVTVVNTPAAIPASATRIHGFNNENITDGYSPMTAVITLVARLEELAAAGIPVVIFNAEWFFDVLSNEAHHAGVTFDLPRGLHIIDPMIIDMYVNPARRAGNRTLPALCRSWNVNSGALGTPQMNVTAALRIAWRIGTSYPLVRDMTPADLHAAQAQWKREADDEREIHFASRGKSDPSAVRRVA